MATAALNPNGPIIPGTALQGATGTVLTSNGPGVAPSFYNPHAMQLVAAEVVTVPTGYIQFDSVLDSNYGIYNLVVNSLVNLTPAAGSVGLTLRYTSLGVPYTTNYQGATLASFSGSSTANQAVNSTVLIPLTVASSTVDTRQYINNLYIFTRPLNASPVVVSGVASVTNYKVLPDIDIGCGNTYGVRTVDGPVDGFRLLFTNVTNTTASDTTGTVTLYKIQN